LCAKKVRRTPDKSSTDATNGLLIQPCVAVLSNDVRSGGFADLVTFILGDTGVPYDWEYGDRAGKS
jgi:hypothetical protein